MTSVRIAACEPPKKPIHLTKHGVLRAKQMAGVSSNLASVASRVLAECLPPPPSWNVPMFLFGVRVVSRVFGDCVWCFGHRNGTASLVTVIKGISDKNPYRTGYRAPLSDNYHGKGSR